MAESNTQRAVDAESAPPCRPIGPALPAAWEPYVEWLEEEREQYTQSAAMDVILAHRDRIKELEVLVGERTGFANRFEEIAERTRQRARRLEADNRELERDRDEWRQSAQDGLVVIRRVSAELEAARGEVAAQRPRGWASGAEGKLPISGEQPDLRGLALDMTLDALDPKGTNAKLRKFADGLR